MQKLFALIKTYEVLTWTVTAMYFNCPLDPAFDKKGGIFNSSTTCDKLD